ncbi:MAG: hypothetical protein LQ340_004383 [Diploschistes diacapsis]|nr:MAG: hypothetical protein LQ340_004383 [Diploschistes diacapsis]
MTVRQDIDRSPGRMYVSAGYTDKETYLIDLNSLDLSDQLMTKALEHMSEVRSDYAVYSEVDYKNAFNWPQLLKVLRDLARDSDYLWSEQRQYHVIAFYSQLKPSMNMSENMIKLLYSLDSAAFEEAMEGGGLLKYWFGKPDEELRNLATCVWRSKAEANAVRKKPRHIKAKVEGSPMYRNILIKELQLTVETGLKDLRVDCQRDYPVKSESH